MDNYCSGQVIRFRRKVNSTSANFFDKDWVYGICLKVSGGRVDFCDGTHCESINLSYDVVEPVASVEDIPDTGKARDFRRLVMALEERIKAGKSLFGN